MLYSHTLQIDTYVKAKHITFKWYVIYYIHIISDMYLSGYTASLY